MFGKIITKMWNQGEGTQCCIVFKLYIGTTPPGGRQWHTRVRLLRVGLDGERGADGEDLEEVGEVGAELRDVTAAQ